LEGKTQEPAAAAAGMSVRTARQWERRPLPSEAKGARHWGTRELVPLLARDTEGVLQATTLLDRLLHHGHLLKCGSRSWRTRQASGLQKESKAR